MQIHKQLATRNNCYRRNQGEMGKNPGERDSRYARYYQGPQGVMIHSTGAENPNLRRYVQPDDGTLGVNPNGNDWNRPGLDVAVHAFIGLTRSGEVAAYQILPWEYRAWHCGGDANNTHLSFEICEDGLVDSGYFERTYKAAMELTAELCRKFGLDPLAPGVVIDHAEGARLGIASNHFISARQMPLYGGRTCCRVPGRWPKDVRCRNRGPPLLGGNAPGVWAGCNCVQPTHAVSPGAAGAQSAGAQ